MADDFTRPPEDRVDARTSERVARMSDKERVELARELARRRRAVPGAFPRKSADIPDAPVAPPTPPVPDQEAEIARLEGELRTTERRLARLERSASPARYQGGGSAPPSARYARALTRAEHLERKLRGLR